LVSLRTFDGVWVCPLFAAVLLLVGCGSKHPAEPVPDPPMAVDWDALARLFDDPLFKSLPLDLVDQGAAQSLIAAQSELISGIRARDLEVVLPALSTIRVERETYAMCPCYVPGDMPVLLAISLFEIRGHQYLAHESSSAASAAIAPEAVR
jgi:hypothetical protein